MSEQLVPVETERAAKPVLVERRATVRYACERMTFCRSLATKRDRFWTAIVRDVSRNGIGLLVRSPFPVGSILAVELQGVQFARTLLARVVHTQALASGGHVLGCLFASQLSDKEVQALL